MSNSAGIGGLFVPTYYEGDGARAAEGKENPAVVGNGKEVKAKKCRNLAMGPAVSKRALLPPLIFNGNIEYIQTMDAADKAARAIESAGVKMAGFDIEWRVSFKAGEAPRRTATLQLCAPNCPPGTRESPVWGTTFIFHLCHMYLTPSCSRGTVSSTASSTTLRDEKHIRTELGLPLSDEMLSSGGLDGGEGDEMADCSTVSDVKSAADFTLPDALVRVLSDPDLLLVGVGIGGDVTRLEREYWQLTESGGMKGIVDLSELAKRKVAPEKRKRGTWSLADLTEEMLGLQLRKPQALRRGNWEKRPLNVDQLEYAATDAYAGMRLWQVMQTMPDMVLQRSTPNSGSLEGKTVGSEESAKPSVTDAGRHDARVDVPLTWEERRNREGGKPTGAAKMSLAKCETHRLWHVDGLSVEDVAEVRCIKASTVLGYIADCIEAGMPYDWDRINIDSSIQTSIIRALCRLTERREPSVRDASDQRREAGSAVIDRPASIKRSPDRSGKSCVEPFRGFTVSEAKISFTGASDSTADGRRVENNSQATEDATIHVGFRGEEVSHSHSAKSTRIRWDSIRLKEVKELAPEAEYWQIKMIIARLRSGWQDYDTWL